MRWPAIARADLAERTRAVLLAAGLVNLGEVVALADAGRLDELPGMTVAIRGDIRGLIADLRDAESRRGKSPRPIGGGGLMGLNRARRAVETDDARSALHRALDFFPTEPWAGRAVGELIRQIDPVARSVHEPAAGEGHLAYALSDYFADVRTSDVYGHGGRVACVRDYLGPPAAMDLADWMVTNPPFDTSAEFVRTALQRARRGVAVLQRLTWIETVGRHDLFFGETPLTLKVSFAQRTQMRLGQWDPEGSGQTPCAWYLWLKPDVDNSSIDPRVRAAWRLKTYVGAAFPPGSKARLTRPDDASKFGVTYE